MCALFVYYPRRLLPTAIGGNEDNESSFSCLFIYIKVFLYECLGGASVTTLTQGGRRGWGKFERERGLQDTHWRRISPAAGMWHDSRICVIWRAVIYVWYEVCMYETQIEMSFVCGRCVTWLICMCDMTHSYSCDMNYASRRQLSRWVSPAAGIWHDSFMCVTWRTYIRAIEGWGAGVEYHFQEYNEPYAPS